MKLILSIISFAFFSCNSMQNAKNQEVELQKNKWILEYAIKPNNQKWIPKKQGVFAITFDNQNRFSAKTDCNTMGGSYTVDGTKLNFGQIMATEMWCEGSEEGIFGSLLSQVESYKLLKNNDLEIYLKDSKGKMVFKKT